MAALSMLALCRTRAAHAPDAQRISSTHLLPDPTTTTGHATNAKNNTCPGTDEVCPCPQGNQPSWTNLSSCPGRSGERGVGHVGGGSAWLLQECADLMVLETRRGLK